MMAAHPTSFWLGEDFDFYIEEEGIEFRNYDDCRQFCSREIHCKPTSLNRLAVKVCKWTGPSGACSNIDSKHICPVDWPLNRFDIWGLRFLRFSGMLINTALIRFLFALATVVDFVAVAPRNITTFQQNSIRRSQLAH